MFGKSGGNLYTEKVFLPLDFINIVIESLFFFLSSPYKTLLAFCQVTVHCYSTGKRLGTARNKLESKFIKQKLLEKGRKNRKLRGKFKNYHLLRPKGKISSETAERN